MAESLLAILLVTSSAKGTNLVFHWPAFPSSQPRLARPKPYIDESSSQIDAVWLAATNQDDKFSDRKNVPASIFEDPAFDDCDYEWKRPNAYRERSRSHSFADSSGRSRPGSRRASPSKDGVFSSDVTRRGIPPEEAEYENLLGYPAEFLANILCPTDEMCHQKFELVVDDMAFIGHPVCAEADGSWKFKAAKADRSRRGRNSRENGGAAEPEPIPEMPTSPAQMDSQEQPTPTASSSSQHIFHLVFVIDLPDPSSSASGNLFKYFHIIYEQIAFTVTAVLYQEQVLHRFVDTECESLGVLRETCFRRNDTYAAYVAEALDQSSLARAMKTLYDAVKSNTIARLVINEIGVEVQLPPQLDSLLHAEEENPDYVEHEDPDGVSWGPELSFGWGLPTLAPWKSLLLYNMEEEQNDLKMNLNQPGLSQEDQMLAEGLIQFLETVSIFDSLAVVARSLDWDLERQVYPTVRWLVYHRRAKIVDTVHRGLRTVFALPSKMERSLPELTTEFDAAFPQSVIPPLPKLFASISNPSSSVSTPFSPSLSHSHSRELHIRGERDIPPPTVAENNHFFATVVKSKDLIPVYQDVVVWLLRRDLLVTLHLRIRIVATPDVKESVRKKREAAARRRFDRRMSAGADIERGRERERGGRRDKSAGVASLPGAKKGKGSGGSVRRKLTRPVSGSQLHEYAIGLEEERNAESFVSRTRRRRLSSKSIGASTELTGLIIPEEDRYDDIEAEGDDIDAEEDEDSSDEAGDKWDTTDDNHLPSIIPEPGQATPLQRKWIEAMSDGKNDELARRFRQINQYFDGKRTDDEILYRADITRRQLREVLHHYQEFLLTFLHPA